MFRRRCSMLLCAQATGAFSNTTSAQPSKSYDYATGPSTTHATAAAATHGSVQPGITYNTIETKAVAKEKAKKFWKDTIVEGAKHMYHGFKLFGANTRLAWKYSRKMKQGIALTRRERILLEKATADLLRLVPFSVFIIVPGGELLLPVALKMFPGIIPSTFETQEQGFNKAYDNAIRTMKARKRMIEYMTTSAIAHSTTSDTHVVLRKITTGDRITEDDIRKVAHMCKKNGPLGVYQLPQDMLESLGQSVGIRKWYLRFTPKSWAKPHLQRLIIDQYWKLKQDDRILKKEGFAELTKDELVKACQARGMRWLDSEEALTEQLEWWVNISQDAAVPYNALFWVKPTSHSLQKTLAQLSKEERSKLLGIVHLPRGIQEQMEIVTEKIEKHKEQELEDIDYEEISRSLEEMSSAESKASAELDGQDVQKAIGEYLNNDDKIIQLYDEILEAEGKVTIALCIEYLATDIKFSSHMVSIVFDALEMGSGKSILTVSKLRSLAKRCKEPSK